MVRSPAAPPQPATTARDVPGPPGDHTVQVIGHAGLAIQSAGGSPTRRHLDEALALDVDRLELDVCCTADGMLVMRHDVALPGGASVSDLHLARLRSADPGVLTIDEAVEHIDGRVPVLFDLKTARSAQLLGTWLRRRRDADLFALCTENLPWLLHLRFAAPCVARWPTFPHLGGLPWREQLPHDLAQVCADTVAAGICVHHRLITDRLVAQSRRLGLHVNAWTVNNPFGARMMALAGVDSVTTDRVDLVRIAVRSQSKIGQRPTETSPLRAVAHIAPR